VRPAPRLVLSLTPGAASPATALAPALQMHIGQSGHFITACTVPLLPAANSMPQAPLTMAAATLGMATAAQPARAAAALHTRTKAAVAASLHGVPPTASWTRDGAELRMGTQAAALTQRQRRQQQQREQQQRQWRQ
jgi:hypothetical protein